MKPHAAAAAAVALALAASQFAAMPAYAEQAAFRTAAPKAFSAEDLQRYGLNAEQRQRAADLERQGYRVMVLSHDEAKAYTAGITDSQWLLIGILAAVIVIAVAVAD
jgi:hypothetical protein